MHYHQHEKHTAFPGFRLSPFVVTFAESGDLRRHRRCPHELTDTPLPVIALDVKKACFSVSLAFTLRDSPENHSAGSPSLFAASK
jgi:hypothetical protein